MGKRLRNEDICIININLSMRRIKYNTEAGLAENCEQQGYIDVSPDNIMPGE